MVAPIFVVWTVRITLLRPLPKGWIAVQNLCHIWWPKLLLGDSRLHVCCRLSVAIAGAG